MKKLFLLPLLFIFMLTSKAQDESKYKQLEQTVNKLIQVISGPKDQKRDLKAFKSLFIENARMGWCTKKDNQNKFVLISLDDFIKKSWNNYSKYGFKEKVYKNNIRIFGSMAQVFQSYGTSINNQPERNRGINNIQLIYENKKWKIVSIIWENETNKEKIPTKYLK